MTTKQNDVLKALLAANEDVRATVFMKRFGIDFEIKALTNEVAQRITERATRRTPKGNHFDEQLFNYLTIVEGCVVPNWKDQELLEALGVHDGVDAVKKKLLFGEVATLIQEIASLNGFDKSDDEQIEDAKN